MQQKYELTITYPMIKYFEVHQTLMCVNKVA